MGNTFHQKSVLVFAEAYSGHTTHYFQSSFFSYSRQPYEEFISWTWKHMMIAYQFSDGEALSPLIPMEDHSAIILRKVHFLI